MALNERFWESDAVKGDMWLTLAKQVRKTFAGLGNYHTDYESTDQSLQTLESILEHILSLSDQYPSITEVSGWCNLLSPVPKEPLDLLLDVVKRCKDDMLTLVGRMKTIESSRQMSWPQRLVGTFSIFLKTEDLTKIRRIVSSNVNRLFHDIRVC